MLTKRRSGNGKGLRIEPLEDRSLMSSTTMPVTPIASWFMTEMNGAVYFTGWDSQAYTPHGWELYKTNGTEGGTELVKDINPIDLYGPYSSSPHYFTPINGTLYFTADDGEHGRELWKTTATGAIRVKDIIPGIGGSEPEQLTNVDGTLYFSANNGIDGRELWKSDGTDAGTVMVKNISYGSAFPQHLTNFNGTLFFTADEGPNGHGRELWKSNGTAAGTVRVKDIKPGINSSQPVELTVMGNRLYFSADNGVHGRELWKSNGTAAGTYRVKDIFVGDNSSPLSLVASGNTLYFSATSSSGRELWKSNGTAAGTVRVKDISVGAGNSSPTDLTIVEGQLYFAATDFDGRSTHGRELWTSDGTEKGTQMVRDNYSGAGSSSPSRLVAAGNSLYYSTAEGENWTADYNGQGWMWKAGQRPVIVTPGNQTHNEGATVSLTVSSPSPAPVTFTVSGLPAGLTFNPKTRRIAGTIAQSAGVNSPYTVTVTAKHEWMTSSSTFKWTVRDVTPPVVVNPGAQFSNEGNTVSLGVTATDAGGDPLTFGAVNLPAGLDIDPATGVISGTVGWQAAGNYSVTVSATDGQKVGSKAFAWTIADITPPSIVNPGPQQHNEGNTISLAINASDPEGDTLTFTATGLPPGLNINTVTGLISGTLGNQAAGVYQVVLAVSDGSNTVSTTFTWTIANLL